MSSLKTEQLRQLGAGKKERYAALETHHDAFGNQIDDRACLCQPRQKSNERNQQGCARCEGAETGCVSTGELPDRGSHKQRDRRGDSDCSISRAAKYPEDETGENTRVKPRLWRQVRQ